MPIHIVVIALLLSAFGTVLSVGHLCQHDGAKARMIAATAVSGAVFAASLGYAITQAAQARDTAGRNAPTVLLRQGYAVSLTAADGPAAARRFRTLTRDMTDPKDITWVFYAVVAGR